MLRPFLCGRVKSRPRVDFSNEKLVRSELLKSIVTARYDDAIVSRRVAMLPRSAIVRNDDNFALLDFG